MKMDSSHNSPVNLSRSSSLRLTSSNANRTSLVRRNQSINAKQIRFFRNGDRFFGGLNLAVSSERYKEFDCLLAELSQKLNLSSGAVRCIFNADDNSMITDISQLQYGVPYVCSSSNTFRQIEGGYGRHMQSWAVIATSKQNYKPPSILGDAQKYNILNNLRTENGRDFIKPKLVTVIRNGKPPQKKVTLLLNCKTAISYDQVLDQLSAKGSLGKVDKLYTVDGRMIKSLRDLFDDDTVFIAFSLNEKFPDDGVELDPNSYRITPYRELKRPSNMTVRRTNSLRHNSIGHYSHHDVENLPISRLAKNMRPKNMSPNGKGVATKVQRPKSGSLKKFENKEELYPTSVFETDSSDSAKAKRKSKGNTKHSYTMDNYYNTVWLSDFESIKSFGSRSGVSSTNQSQHLFDENESRLAHSTPRSVARTYSHPSSASSFISSCSQPKTRMHRTLSLPESELANLNAEDLQERFSRLQVEQENRELRQLVRDLQEALEKLEHSVVTDFQSPTKCINCSQNIGNNFLLTATSIQQSYRSNNQSPDSLEGSDERSMKSMKSKDRNESGYITLNNESLNEDQIMRKESLVKHYNYTEFSDTLSFASSLDEEDKNFYESRLLKKRKHIYDESGCCMMQ